MEPTVTRLHPIKALFTFPVFLSLKDVEICGDLMSTQYSQIPLNTLPQKYSTMMKSFLSSQKYTKALFTSRVFEEMEGDYFVSRNFPDRLFTSLGFERIILGYPHKFPPL
jgi:hypothetical protein